MNTLLEYSTKKLTSCCYINTTNKFKILRISQPYNPNLEKVIPPGTKFYFQAQPEAFLEIHSYDFIGSILEDRLTCSHFQI